jgi:hypothetical protein
VDPASVLIGGFGENRAQFLASWVGHAYMGDNAITEKGVSGAGTGAIIILIRQNNVPGLVSLLKAADGGHTDNPADVQLPESVDIGTVIQLMRHDPMSFAVAWQEIDLTPLQTAAHDRIRGCPEGSLHLNFCGVSEALQLVKPAATNHSNARLASIHMGYRYTQRVGKWNRIK